MRQALYLDQRRFPVLVIVFAATFLALLTDSIIQQQRKEDPEV